MATPQEILQGLIDDSDEQVENLQGQIDQIDSLIDNLEETANALERGVKDVDATALVAYLDATKIEDIRPLSFGGDLFTSYGPNYNVSNITDWQIIDATTFLVLYSYQGVNWDNDSTINRHVDSWDWAQDYLYHPLTTFDGTYGIYPNIATLENAKSTLEGTKQKISETEDQLEDKV